MPILDEIKARLDIVDIVSETVKLRRSGKSYTGFCPFHSNTRTPSFVVWPETGTWRCFGQCNEGGDVVGYVMKRDGLDFGEALRRLAERAGVELQTRTPQQVQQIELGDRLRELLEEAARSYQDQLYSTPAGQEALTYLHGRGLNDETLRAFGLGYAPRGWDFLLRHFRARKVGDDLLKQAGLVSENDSGGIYDRFRHRVMIPINDGRGRITGFGARILDPNDIPKFLNSPQTELFDKGRLLYGLDRARRAIRAKDQVVIVEGYLDVIMLHQYGFENAVSPMGTALTEDQLRLLKPLTKRIVLALDSDAAGSQATLRGLEVARNAMDREAELGFDARGWLRVEGRLSADLRVATLPEGMDPDDFVRQDASAWERLINAAKPVVLHVLESLLYGRDVNDPKVKSEIALQVLPLIEEVPGIVERDAYRQHLARALRVDEHTLARIRPQAKPYRRPESPVTPGSGAARPGTKAGSSNVFVQKSASQEGYILGLLLRHPDMFYQVDRQLLAFGLGRMMAQDFSSADHQAIFGILSSSLMQDYADPQNFTINSLSEPLIECAEGLMELTKDASSDKNWLLKNLLKRIIDIRLQDLDLRNHEIRNQIQDLQEKNEDTSDYFRVSAQLSKTRGRLHDANASVEKTREWMGQRK